MNLRLPDLGVGVGLRVPHYAHILGHRPAVDFFEIISENFMVSGGKPLHHLERVLETYPVVQHGVSLNIGGPEPLDVEYLRALKALARSTRTPWVSDHFCWCGAGGAHLHDLFPLPYTNEAIRRLVERARQVQDFLEVPFALENTSSYLSFKASTLAEWQFIAEIAERANIGLLFDVNNVYVSAYNQGFDPIEFIQQIPAERVVQIHLASHSNAGKYLIDTHRGHVVEAVWALYRLTIERTGPVSTLIEWDDEIPEFTVLQAEAERARAERTRALDAAALGESSVDVDAVRSALAGARGAVSDPGSGWNQGGPRELASRDDSHRAPCPG